MNCPKCGNENADNVWICRSCRHVLRDNMTVKSRISRLAVLSLVLGVSSSVLFVLTGLPAIIIGVVSIVRIRRSGGRLRGKYVALAGMNLSIALMCIFFLLWSRDAPPIPNDYTVADLRSAPAECAESFEILKTLIDESWGLPGSPAIGLTERDAEVIKEVCEVLKEGTTSDISKTLDNYAEDIKHAWAGTGQARQVIARLNGFPEIADLTEPGLGVKTMRWHNLITFVRVYRAYARLQTQQADVHTLTVKLIELDSVCRKISLNARILVPKLICLVCIEQNMTTGNCIVNNPAASSESLSLLAEHFKPLTDEQMSLRNGILCEYLLLKDTVSEVAKQGDRGKNILLKSNSMLRLYRNFYDDWIDSLENRTNAPRVRFSVWPDAYPFAEPSISFDNEPPLTLLYRVYNPLVTITGFIYKEGFGRTPSTWIYDDLLQIVLDKRLGREVSLKARADGEEYILDVEDKKIFSTGPDGKAGTKDDIKLPINPEVLQMDSQGK